MAYAFDDGDIEFWWHYEPFPKSVTDYFKSGEPIMAHNAEFERHLFEWVISNDYHFTPPKLEQWRCSMAIGLTNGFAGGLDALAVGLELPYRKNPQGARLIREYCSPGHESVFKQGDDQIMKDYCLSDVEIMRAAVKCLRTLTDSEWAEYHLNCRINQRGLPIDVAFCEAALGYTKEVAEDANRQIAELTDGAMTKATQRKARDAWLFPKLTKPQMKLLEVYKDGEVKISLDGEHRRYLLNRDDLDADARALLEFIDNAGSSALKKFAVAAHQQCLGRVYNTFLWNGAGRTGRFSGKGLQPHNIRRDVFGDNEAEALIQDIIAGYELENPANTMARLLRAMIAHKAGLAWCDWSSIEGRVAPWLSCTKTGDEKLILFREGQDIYKVTAGQMFDEYWFEVSKAQRQAGKIAELSLQFGGSHNALIGMAKNYGITFEEDEARDIVKKWRFANPWAEQIWAAYDTAITDAVLNPGTEFTVGRVTYMSDDGNYLWCQLPSERMLAYPRPKFEAYFTPWDEERIGVTFQSHFKPAAGEPPIRIHARGALLFQNSVQAVAADCLREAVVVAHDAGLKIVMHCHDEIVIQGSHADGERLNEIMLEQPWWAAGLPLATGGVQSATRWGK
tara:strand:- start:576 stop:2438 length:1863 start_codon:yes stop_codon:yes gene_type:complete